MNAKQEMSAPPLRYCVEWRPYLWLRPLAYALGDPARFAGKRVLDLGCRFGKMSCWFAAQGAIVDGLDLSKQAIAVAKAEQSKWSLGNDVLTFRAFDGDLSELAVGQYDFVFTKSVLTVIGDPNRSLSSISALLRRGGQYLAVENAAAGFPVSVARRWLHRRWNSSGNKFYGIDDSLLALFRSNFGDVSYRKYWGLVLAIQARKIS